MSKLHWLALSAIPGIGGATAKRLIERFGNIEAAWNASAEELQRIPRMTDEVVALMRAMSLEALEEELVSLIDEGIQVISWEESNYPGNLRLIGDAPPLLFVRGELSPADDWAVAIVGSRESTSKSAEIAKTLAFELSKRGLTIVSGLALGIDAAAHEGALRNPQGRTIAVLGSGIRVIHPRENLALAEKIREHGALLSELHPNAPPSGRNLMARDRIVSGMSRAVIVIEAGEKSGSLDTAGKARRQGRLVFAVPGSPGTEALLREGAERLDAQNVDLDKLALQISAHTSGDGKKQLSLWDS